MSLKKLRSSTLKSRLTSSCLTDAGASMLEETAHLLSCYPSAFLFKGKELGWNKGIGNHKLPALLLLSKNDLVV